MAHTYQEVTKSDNAFTVVSDVRPDGAAEDQFTWANINPHYDTWLKLLAKIHWCDWYYGTAFVDAWKEVTV